MTDVAFLMPLVVLFGGLKGARTLLSDGDTGWHLRTGEWILAHGRVPDRDIFSFTRSGQPWFAWEWLWDVMFGWLHLHGGMTAVVLASSVVLALTFALLFRLARRRSDGLVALAATLAAAGASTGHWLARPHLFTMLFLVVFSGILERAGDDEAGRRRLWLLPPLMVLWTNLHGGFPAGIVLIGVYAAGEFAVLLRDPDESARRQALEKGRRYLYAAAACGLASLVNPYFYRLHAHIAGYLMDGFYRANIMEFQPLNFQSGQARFLEVLLAAGAAAVWVRMRRGNFTWPLVFVLWGHLALASARHVEIYAVLAAAPAAEAVTAGLRWATGARLAGWLRQAAQAAAGLAAETSAMDRGPRWYAASAAAVLALGIAMYAARAGSMWHATYDERSFPVGAAVRLEQAGVYGGVFTQDLWGGYLIYRQYPRGRVFIDGRSDFYGPGFVGRYMRVLGAQGGWEQYLSGYGVETVLLPPEAPLAAALKQSGAWRLVYDDGVALVFRSGQAIALPMAQVSGGPPAGASQTATTGRTESRL